MADEAAGPTPEDEVVAGLIEIWREVLEDGGLGADSDFTASGGTSLAAVRIRSRVRDRLLLEVSLEQIFDHPAPAQLAGLLAAAAPVQAP